MIDGEWDDFVPIRLPVDWEYRGEAGIHPEIEGITGKEVVLLIEKRLGMLSDGKHAWLKVVKNGRIHTNYITNITICPK